MNTLTFNGESSADYGIFIGGQETFNAPQRDVTKYSIPGRNGDLVRDNDRFLNIEVSYPVVILSEFADTSRLVNAWMSSAKGYCRLEDTYHPNHFRMARCTGGITYETGTFNRVGKGKLIFDCKPQRWLKSGETSVQIATGGSITNPTRFTAKPFIRVYGSGTGTLTVGSKIITFDDIDGYVDIDSEIMDCYKGSANKNSYVHMASGFPTLPAGETGIIYTGNITNISIKGRWWTV